MGLQAIRRGTWLAVQLQLVFACMAFLLTFQALQYASQQPQSGWLHALEAAVPYLAASAVAGALLCRPWAIARRKESSDTDAISGSREPEPEHAAASEGAKRDENMREPNLDLELKERSSLHKPPEHVSFLNVQTLPHCPISAFICYPPACPAICATSTETEGSDRILLQAVMSLRSRVWARLIPAKQMPWAHHAVIVWRCVQDASVVPSAEDFEGWPDAPLLVRPAPLDYQQVHSDATGGAVCINDGG